MTSIAPDRVAGLIPESVLYEQELLASCTSSAYNSCKPWTGTASYKGLSLFDPAVQGPRIYMPRATRALGYEIALVVGCSNLLNVER